MSVEQIVCTRLKIIAGDYLMTRREVCSAISFTEWSIFVGLLKLLSQNRGQVQILCPASLPRDTAPFRRFGNFILSAQCGGGNHSGLRTSPLAHQRGWAGHRAQSCWLLRSYSCENLSDFFLWMNPKLQLRFSSSDPCNEYHLNLILFFWTLKSNDPWSPGCQFKHTGDISLFIRDVRFVSQKGRCSWLLGTGLALVSYFSNQF